MLIFKIFTRNQITGNELANESSIAPAGYYNYLLLSEFIYYTQQKQIK